MIRNGQSLLAIALTLCLGLPFASAFQEEEKEIEVIDQDGQRVEVSIDDNEDGKIIIVDENGKRQEIDVAGAHSIIVNKSVSSILKDGEEQQKVSGKAIIIGPDGQRQEIELGDDLLGVGDFANFKFEPLPHLTWMKPGKLHIQSFAGGSKYAIGVHCQEVSDALRAHIDIDDGLGLVVTNEPVVDSPAAKAGIQKHDILLSADQTELSKMSDLVTAIQTAGTDEQELSITLQRKGKEIGVTVVPVKRAKLGAASGGLIHPGFKFQLDEIGPGIILGDKDEMLEGIIKRMDELDEQFQEKMDDFMLLREELNDALQKQNDK